MALSIIPQPVKVTEKQGQFVLDERTAIAAGEALRPVARMLQKMISPATGFDLRLKDLEQGQGQGNVIMLAQAPERSDLGAEGYLLRVSPEVIALSAPAAAGLFYGLQTLRQLLPVEVEQPAVVPGFTWTVPCVEIEDKPRFSWRGLMLDVGRHFHGVDTVKRMLDLMALHKLNRFHWHLTEDQGGRIEI